MDHVDPLRATMFRLEVRAGPARGTTIRVESGEVVIGRDPTCGLCLPDATLSRQHAVLVADASTLLVRDLGSLNGVRVNGAPVQEGPLAVGDRIELGGSVLVVAGPGSDPEPDEASGGEPTLRLSAGCARWGAESAPDARSAHALDRLLHASRRFAESRTEEALASALVTAALQAAPAAGSTLLVREEGGLRVAAARARVGPGPVPGVSRTAATRAIEGREALVWGGEMPPPGPEPESLRASGRRAVFVPLVSGGEASGVLALVRDPAEPPFDRDDVELLFGLAASAASALAVVRHIAWLEGERSRLSVLESPGEELLGASATMSRVRALVTRAAASDATVLLLGESGTGKELAARAIHARSARRSGPFVAVNGAALVDTLVESELFGHERGAFTGAVARHRGRLELAHRGTLFLDELGEMSPGTQAKLLRVLETRQFERVGGTEKVSVDVRVVAATNRDLAAEAKAGRFREDLFHRLAVVTLSMPPLRERREDLPALASHFLARHAERQGRRFQGFSPAALARLVAHDWPGNVRELSNVVERAVVLADGDLVRLEDLPEALLEAAGGTPDGGVGLPPYHEAVNRAKREAVGGALARSHGNVTEAARLLGLHPNYLHRLLNQLGLRRE